MAQFEAQADKAAASSKAAKEAKSKETKEEREKREKYEKLMKKAEELTAARNHRGSRQCAYTGEAHANAAQLKEIEEKIKAADTEMNRGSLFDLMDRKHSRNLLYSSNSHTPNSRHTHRQRNREIRNRNVRNKPAPQQTYTRRPSQPMPGQAQPAPQRPQQAYTQHPQQPGIWPSQQQPPQPQARPQIQPHAQYVQRTGGQQPSNLNIRRSLNTGLAGRTVHAGGRTATVPLRSGTSRIQ